MRERKRMVCILRKHGREKSSEYRSIEPFKGSLRHIHQRDNLRFYMDSRVFRFMVKGWI